VERKEGEEKEGKWMKEEGRDSEEREGLDFPPLPKIPAGAHDNCVIDEAAGIRDQNHCTSTKIRRVFCGSSSFKQSTVRIIFFM